MRVIFEHATIRVNKSFVRELFIYPSHISLTILRIHKTSATNPSLLLDDIKYLVPEPI